MAGSMDFILKQWKAHGTIETLRRSCSETGLYWKDGLEVYFREGVGVVWTKVVCDVNFTKGTEVCDLVQAQVESKLRTEGMK